MTSPKASNSIANKVPSPRFDRMMERSPVNSIYYRNDPVKDDYDPRKLQKALSVTSKRRKNGAHLNWAKQKERDMKMYNQTEQMKNIKNENERYYQLQKILSEL